MKKCHFVLPNILNSFQQRPVLIILGRHYRDNTLKKIILTLALATMTLPAIAGYHPVARGAAIASSDHPVAMATATSGNGNNPVARGVVVANSDNPVAMAAATGNNGRHPVARTAVVANSDNPVAAAVVTGH
jgi:hypothetical protein